MTSPCEICMFAPVVFVAIFPDGHRFLMCAGCTDDLCALQETFFLDVTVMSASMLPDEHPYIDPAEIA